MITSSSCKFLKQTLVSIILILVSFFGFTQVNLDSGLVGYFMFDNNSVDSSSLGIDGVATDVVSVNGYKNYANSAYQFNGATSQVSCNINGRTITNTVVVSLWVNTILTTGHKFLMEKYDWQNDKGYYLAIKDGYPYVAARNTSGFGSFTWNDNSEHIINDGNWHHLLAVVSNNDLQFWIDGQLEADTTLNASNPDLTTNVPLSIGYYYIGSATGDHNYFKGSIDQVRLFNRLLTTDEIGYLSNENNITGFIEIVGNESISIYPNPTKYSLHITSSFSVSKVELLTIQGNSIGWFDLSDGAVDVSFLGSGMYLIKIVDAERSKVAFKKFIKN